MDHLAEGPARVLSEILRCCSADLDAATTLGELLRLAVEVLEAERGSLILLDSVGRVVQRVSLQSGFEVEESAGEVARVIEDGLAGWAIRHQQVALAADIRVDGRWYHFHRNRAASGSAIALPLFYQGDAIGVLTLQHTQPGFFGADHARLGEYIADQLAIAVARTLAHDAARRERRTLRALLAALPDPVILVDSDGRITLANEKAVEVLGQDVVGRPIAEALHESEAEDAFRAVTQGAVSQELQLQSGDGRIFEVVFTPVAGLGVVLRFQDVTRVRELDEMKSWVVSAVSHDLRNPLTYVRGFAEVLSTEEGLSDAARRCVEGILSGAQRMHHLIERLLDLARIEEGLVGESGATSDVGSIAEGVGQSLAGATAAKNQSLQIEVPPGLPAVRMGADDLRRVLVNLMENAVKYTQPGGSVRVEARAEGEGVRVSVIDNGPGICAEAQARLFEKFYRVSDPRIGWTEGSGLGLAIVRGLVGRHGGKVGVESEEGKGSTFWFWLPGVVPPDVVA